MSAVRFAAILAIAGCAGDASTVGCTEIGCLTSFDVDLRVAAVDGATLDLTVTAGDASDACSGVPTDGVLQCAAFGIRVDGGTYRLIGSTNDEAPVPVHVVLLVDSASAFDADLTLDWGTPDRPNGPDCPPACYSVTGG